ncbi:MAG: 50S ribosomal protein L11 methyltransferase [Desulfobacterales bacterium]|nr:50S ribosomal protein L11 methyltransferase [Desulfobacterales bacterium]
MPITGEKIRKSVLEVVSAAASRKTPRQVEQAVAAQTAASSRAIREAIRTLTSDGTLTYTSLSGTSFLERSFRGPIQVSRRIWLCPGLPRNSRPASDPAIRIRILQGAAFGFGDHPTTRLSLRGIDFTLDVQCQCKKAIDIGTGSGVLAIAAALLGVERVLAVEIDPCARTEAAANVAENGLTGRVSLSDLPSDGLKGPFSLILANLRPPTLSAMAKDISRLAAPGARAVFSGFHPEEWAPVEVDYRSLGWHTIWQETENQWMAAVCTRE